MPERAPIRIAPIRAAPRGIEGSAPKITRSLGSTPTIGRLGLEGFSSRIPNIGRNESPTTRAPRSATLFAVIPPRPANGEGLLNRLRPFETGVAQVRATHSSEGTQQRKVGKLRRFDVVTDGNRTNLLGRTGNEVHIVNFQSKGTNSETSTIANPRPPDYSRIAQPIETGIAPVINLNERRRTREVQARPAITEHSTSNVVRLDHIRREFAQIALEDVKRLTTGTTVPQRPEISHKAVILPFRRKSEHQTSGGRYKTELAILSDRKLQEASHQQDEVEKRYLEEKKRVERHWFDRVSSAKKFLVPAHPFATSQNESTPFPNMDVREFLGSQRVPLHVRMLQRIAQLRGQVYEVDDETKKLLAEEDAKRKKEKWDILSRPFLQIFSYNGDEHNPKHDVETVITDPAILTIWKRHFSGDTQPELRRILDRMIPRLAEDSKEGIEIIPSMSPSGGTQDVMTSREKSHMQRHGEPKEHISHIVFHTEKQGTEPSGSQNGAGFSKDDPAQEAREKIGLSVINALHFEGENVVGYDVANQMGRASQGNVVSQILRSFEEKVKYYVDGSYKALLFLIATMGFVSKRQAEAVLENGLTMFPAVKLGNGEAVTDEQVSLVMSKSKLDLAA